MRLLGIDVGKRRIGLAVSDVSAILATPLRVVQVSGAAEHAVVTVAREIALLESQEGGLAGVVVGLPRTLDGKPHLQTKHVIAFVESLRQRTTQPIRLQDERLTSHEADGRLAMHEKDWRRRKTRLDAASAAIILQDYLDHQTRQKTRDQEERGG